MKIRLLLLGILFNSILFAQSPTPEFIISASNSCPYTDITITNTTTPNVQIIAWNWTFENGVPATYSGENPPLVQWEKEGEFIVKLEITVDCSLSDIGDPQVRLGDESCIYTESYQIPITIDARCCADLPIYTQSMLDLGILVDKVFQVDGDLVVSTGTSFEVMDGSLLFNGEAVPNSSGPGGYSGGPFLKVEDGASVVVRDGILKAWCNEMWGGIGMSGGASINMTNSNMEDSDFGIFADLGQNTTTNAYDVFLKKNKFLNNYRTLYIDESGNAIQKMEDNYIFSDPNEMRSPYSILDPNNLGEPVHSLFGFYFGTFSSFWPGQIDFNIFENLMAGIVHYPKTGYGRIELFENQFLDNKLAGVIIFGTEIFRFNGCTFATPIDVQDTWNYKEALEAFCPKVNGQCINPNPFASASYGIYVDLMDAPMFVENGCHFRTISSNTDPSFQATRQRIGIRTPKADASNDINVQDSYFTNLHEAIVCEETETMIMQSNVIENCIYGFKISNNSSPNTTYDLVMTCNAFKQPFNHPFNRYGLYLESGSALDDIGGANSINAPDMPSGNGFPVDPVVSTPRGWDPIPANACFGSGCAGDAGEWQVPGGWYSIYDGNATSNTSIPSFRYYRYDNEFVGDLNNHSSVFGVYPNGGFFGVIAQTSEIAWMYDPQQGAPPATCGSTSGIPFPNPKIARLTKGSFGHEIEIFPNPSRIREIRVRSVYEIYNIELHILSGKNLGLLPMNPEGNGNYKINIPIDQPSGIYFLKIRSENGVSSHKLILNE